MTEAQLDKKIRDEIRRRGGKVYKLHGTQFSTAGAPDLIGCLHGTPFAIEVKLPGNKPTPKQAHELELWREQLWAAGYATSVEEALQIILSHPLQLEKPATIDSVRALVEHVREGELCECGREKGDCSTFNDPEGGHYDR